MTTLGVICMVIWQCYCIWSWQNRSATLLRQSKYRDLLLSISTTSFCEHVRNTAAAHITWIPHSIHDHPVADLYRWSWGRWRVNTPKYLNVEQRAHCRDTGENQSAVPCENSAVMSYWVRSIRLSNLEFHTRTLYLYNSVFSFNNIYSVLFCIFWSFNGVHL